MHGFKEDTTEYIENPLLSLQKKEAFSTGMTKFEAKQARSKQRRVDQEFQKVHHNYDSIIFPSEAGKDLLNLPTPFQIYRGNLYGRKFNRNVGRQVKES